MTQASIGHHCPECLRQGRQQVYTSRNLPRDRAGLVVALMAVNVIAYVGQLVTGDQLTVDGLLFGPAVADGQWWRVVTSAFLHGSLLHIGLNMWGLWILGNPLEEGLGRLRLALIYLAGTFGGSLAVLSFDFTARTLGASGAVLGLGGALTAVLYSRGIPLGQTNLLPILGLNVFLPLIIPRISFWGHVGGIAAGLAAGFLLAWLPQRLGRSQTEALGATAVLCAVLGGLCLVVARSGGLA
jgi:membrane associated rhomboid family serine protease